MAWPLTPFRTMNNGTTPWDDALGNAIQAGVNGIVAATYTLGGVEIDGTGGAVVAPVLGTMKLSAVAGGTTAPTSTVARKRMYADMVPIAMGYVDQVSNGTATLKWGINVASIATNATGDWTITLNTAMPSINRCSVQATCAALNNLASAIPQSTTTIRFVSYNLAGTPPTSLINSVVFFVVWAGD